MKILHTADLHLGAPMRAYLSAKESKLRREELLSSFLGLLHAAEREGCTAFIIAGDLFDTEAAAATLSGAVLDAIKAHETIDFYYVKGNHEGDACFFDTSAKNLHVFGIDITYFEKENVVFFGKEDIKKSDFDNIHLHHNKINIMVAHGAWADGSNLGADIPLGFLANKGIDYCALGHYHSYAKKAIDMRGIAVYAGTPEGRGFDELGPKGAVLIDTDQGTLTHRFLPLCRRTIYRIEADVSEAKSILDVFSICDRATEKLEKTALVRLVLTGKRQHLPSIDPETVERHLLGRFYYLEAEDASTDAPRIEHYRNEASLHGEFVRTVESDATLSPEERARILSLGLAALNGDMGGDAF